MSGSVQFNVAVYVEGGELPKFMADRLSDMTNFFNVVIDEWSKDNETKFSAGIGMETSGVQIDPGVYWKPLSDGYFKQKLSEGTAGALMVRMGSLKGALTDPNMILRDVGSDHAIFGEPLDPFDALKVSGNWDSRQAIFFSGRDQMMIKEKLIKHITPSGAVGSGSKSPFSLTKSNIARMDAEFEGLMGNPYE